MGSSSTFYFQLHFSCRKSTLVTNYCPSAILSGLLYKKSLMVISQPGLKTWTQMCVELWTVMHVAGTRNKIQFYYQVNNVHSKRHPLPWQTKVFGVSVTASRLVLGQNRATDASGAHCMHAIEIIPSISNHGSKHCSPHHLQEFSNTVQCSLSF